jgi:hypothetical protein
MLVFCAEESSAANEGVLLRWNFVFVFVCECAGRGEVEVPVDLLSFFGLLLDLERQYSL